MKHIYIIGAGGVGSWLTPAICLLKEPSQVTVVDGDILEEKNLNRQLFTEDDIGSNKALALSKRYRCNYLANWYSHGCTGIDSTDWLLVGVDNNPARKAALDSCDAYGCKAVFMANETTSAEAYLYDPKWKGTEADPRVYYPEITTDDTDDPRQAAIGCTGTQQRENRQLVSANFAAASLGMHIFVLWNMMRADIDKEAIPHLPIRIRQNMTKFEVFNLNNTKGKL